jgi:hypothetical protein
MLRIEAPHFVAGLVYHIDKNNECPPIIKYMKTWSINKIRWYCNKKGWKVERIKEVQNKVP